MSFSNILINWYSSNKRDLPWRKTKNPYFIWLSEIILQQTQVKQGLPYYEAFVTEFPTVFHLAKASESEVLKLWQGLGYYSRARNLHFTAKYIVNELNGEFPNTYKGLLQLKGVGDYTASAIASICYEEATAVVDGNVYRVLGRYFGIETPINSTNGIKEFKTLAQELIDEKDPATFNQAIMEFGATQCRPKNPDCMFCPFQDSCVAYNKGTIDKLPVKLKKTKVKQRYFNFLVFLSEDKHTILEKREGKGIWQNLYQFPLIETEQHLDYDAFLKLAKAHPILKNKTFELHQYNNVPKVHKLSHQHLNTTFWTVSVESVENGIPFEKITEYPVPILIGKFIEGFEEFKD
ncbi:A/G-specific adenine glycosylase [Hyunsoonleella pacifica]|uniref:Adenine DNA glycosylase n=1 Tax=Hyunsoonleella pacifica TaxID=1080224 RepID=A0A4Q9FND6_9FLAO|nr:A/G-specific adenine glycosylase [Hyunsoonleella pacifica]TBN15777.1 A/G-specific adenine glycosylase [Hyunsoonleella pacifica]GGD22544.1 A/G-specific adenine glycosylase [Hyunsoonleella pacifica]